MRGPIEVGEGLLAETFAHLRECGNGDVECVAYWTGPCERPQTVDRLVRPPHIATAMSYEVDSVWLNRFWLRLAREGRQLRVQVHTHRGVAFHSRTDDDFAAVQTPGFFSLVIPAFAMAKPSLDGAYVVEINADGEWMPRQPSDALVIVS